MPQQAPNRWRRYAHRAKLRERDVKIVNTSDADIVGAFKSKDSTAAVARSSGPKEA